MPGQQSIFQQIEAVHDGTNASLDIQDAAVQTGARRAQLLFGAMTPRP